MCYRKSNCYCRPDRLPAQRCKIDPGNCFDVCVQPLQLGVVPVVPNAAVPRAAMQGASTGTGAVTPPSPHRLRDGPYRPASKRQPRHLAALEDSGATREPSRVVPQSRNRRPRLLGAAVVRTAARACNESTCRLMEERWTKMDCEGCGLK